MEKPNVKKRANVQKTGMVTVLPIPPVKGPYRVSLTTLSHLRAELGKVYREARSGRLDTQEASRLAFVLATMAKMIEVETFEARLRALEQGSYE